MTTTTRGEGCIGIQAAPVDVRHLLAPCPGKANHECCGYRFCNEHYRQHKAGIHPAKWKHGRAA